VLTVLAKEYVFGNLTNTPPFAEIIFTFYFLILVSSAYGLGQEAHKSFKGALKRRASAHFNSRYTSRNVSGGASAETVSIHIHTTTLITPASTNHIETREIAAVEEEIAQVEIKRMWWKWTPLVTASLMEAHRSQGSPIQACTF